MKSGPQALRIPSTISVDEAQAVLQAAAPGVVTPVGERRPELVDQAGIAGEEVDPVEAALLVADRLIDERLDELANLGVAHGVAAPGVVVADLTGGGPVGRPGVVLIAVSADVIDLMTHDGAMAVAFVGDLAEVGNDGVVGQEVAAREHRRWVRRRRFDDDHGGATPRTLAVVAEVPVERQPALGHVRRVRAEHDAALERMPPETRRREQVGEVLRLRHCALPSPSSPTSWRRLQHPQQP